MGRASSRGCPRVAMWLASCGSWTCCKVRTPSLPPPPVPLHAPLQGASDHRRVGPGHLDEYVTGSGASEWTLVVVWRPPRRRLRRRRRTRLLLTLRVHAQEDVDDVPRQVQH
jgi:hypothetical protein